MWKAEHIFIFREVNEKKYRKNWRKGKSVEQGVCVCVCECVRLKVRSIYTILIIQMFICFGKHCTISKERAAGVNSLQFKSDAQMERMMRSKWEQ